MANPLGAILAGLGGAAGEVGTSMDQKAVLQAQMKRQAAMDAIARMQKIDQMGLTPNTDDSPFANSAALTPNTIPLQTGMSGGTNAAPPPLSASDFAMKQLYTLPDEQGNTTTFRKKTAQELAQDPREVFEANKQAEIGKRLAAQKAADEAAKAIDPQTMRKALDGDMDAVAQVLSKHPELQTTFNRPDKTPPAITDYQRQELALRGRALDLAASRQKGGSDKDAQQMQMAQAMAQPAIDQLKGYFAKQENPNAIARLGSHVPIFGNSIVGAADPDYQKAVQSAEVLATQYVETLPKGRANPALIKQLQTQIAPELGDTPATRAQKLNTILTFERAIQKRAGSAAPPPTSPFADLVPPDAE